MLIIGRKAKGCWWIQTYSKEENRSTTNTYFSNPSRAH